MLSKKIGETELRSLEPWRAAEFYAYAEANRAELGAWLGWVPLVIDQGSARDFLQRYADQTAKDGGRIYGLWLDHQLIGGTLFRVFDAHNSVCELGVWLSADVRGRGYITRAAQAMIDWAIEERGIRRVEWQCTTDNKGSIAVAQRLGMTREGVKRRAVEHQGEIHDVEQWALVAQHSR
ncbi:MAG: GNAT family N-acetyltransferase [Acidimicrobiia bacterium]|nr:GNAT family N-acetyltransferase [Acidimicrobiia bacterium]